jgi:hypothetical protein
VFAVEDKICSYHLLQTEMARVRTFTLYVLSADVFEECNVQHPFNTFVIKAHRLLKNSKEIAVKEVDKLQDLSHDFDIQNATMPCLVIRDCDGNSQVNSTVISKCALRIWFDLHAPDESGFIPFVPTPYQDLAKAFLQDERRLLTHIAIEVKKRDALPKCTTVISPPGELLVFEKA